MTTPPRRRRAWVWRFVIALVTIALCVGAYYAGLFVTSFAGHPRQQPRSTSSELFIAPASLDFGEVWETSEHVISLTVENRSDEVVEVSEFVTGCECSSVEPKGVTLSPRGSAVVRVRLDLTHRQEYHLGLERRPVSVRVVPVTRKPLSDVAGWDLRGVVRSRVSVQPARLNFEDRCVQDGPEAVRTLRGVAHTPVKELRSRVRPDSAATVHADREGDRFEVRVAPRSSLPVGPFEFEVLFTAVEEGGAEWPGPVVRVWGEMQPPTRIVPGSVLLGEHPVGTRAEGEVVLKLPAGEWVVKQVEAESPDVTVRRASRENAVAYVIAQTVRRAGDDTSLVHFTVSSPDGKSHRVTTKVSYYGLPAGEKSQGGR